MQSQALSSSQQIRGTPVEQHAVQRRPRSRSTAPLVSRVTGRQQSSTAKLQRSSSSSRNGSSSSSSSRKTGSSGRSSASGPSQQQTVSSRKTVRERDGSFTKEGTAGSKYFNVTGFPFPLGPITERKTFRYTIDPARIWAFEQRQSLGFTSVSTSTRMTVIKLESGGLWVHAPIAPTKECIALLKELDAPVEYIILPTFAYEHKIFVGPFSRRFPAAKVYVAPSQWSWPINLPPQLFGIFPAGQLVSDATDTPWADEIEQKVLQSTVGIGPYVEVAFFDKRSRTLLVTDAVVYIPERPPPVVPQDALLKSGGDNFILRALGQVTDEMKQLPTTNPAKAMQLGWQRMALLVLFFRPADLADPTPTFRAVANKLIVSPVVQKLVFSNGMEATKRWLDGICASWDFVRIIPCHYAAPIKAGPEDLKRAFSFVYEGKEQQKQQGLLGGAFASLFGGAKRGGKGGKPAGDPFPEADMATLNGLAKLLQSSGILYGKPKDS